MLENQAVFSICILLLSIAVAAALAVVVIKCFRGARRWKQQAHCPAEQFTATVVEKRAAEKQRRTVSKEDYAGFATETVQQYQVVFHLEDGTLRCLEVPETVFSLLAEGDTGVLTVLDGQFVRFERQT